MEAGPELNERVATALGYVFKRGHWHTPSDGEFGYDCLGSLPDFSGDEREALTALSRYHPRWMIEKVDCGYDCVIPNAKSVINRVKIETTLALAVCAALLEAKEPHDEA